MTIICTNCGAEIKVAGSWERSHGSRICDGGQAPPGGKQEWGHYICHQCGTKNTVPSNPIHLDSK